MNSVELRVVERASIEGFVVSQSAKLTGKVLDLGCGKQPYRSVVKAAGGIYFGYDRPDFPGAVQGKRIGKDEKSVRSQNWDAVLCTQVIQYVPDPLRFLQRIRWSLLKDGGWLVISGPTNWPEVESDDLFRYTVKGIAHLLRVAGFDEVDVSSRETVSLNDIHFSLGWGAVGKA